MRLRRVLPAVVLLGAFGMSACDDDDVTGPTVAQFQGNWSASSIVYTNPDNSTHDLMALVSGTSLTLNVAANGSFTGVFHVPGSYDNLAMTGQIENVTATQADVSFDWGGHPQPPLADFTATYTLAGNFLTFVNPSTTSPITEAAASVAINMTRGS